MTTNIEYIHLEFQDRQEYHQNVTFNYTTSATPPRKHVAAQSFCEFKKMSHVLVIY